jgi:cytochrome oxidase assembly protein ShyY1
VPPRRATGSLLSPPWLALHVLTVAAVIGMAWLGWWQATSVAEPAPATAAATPADVTVLQPGPQLADSIGVRVRLEGEYLPQTFTVPGRPGGGADTAGSLVVSPLDTGALVVPVVRGWLPQDVEVTPPAPTGRQQVTGVVAGVEADSDARVPPGSAADPAVLPALTSTLLLQRVDAAPSRLALGLVVAERTAAADETAGLQPAPAPSRDVDGVAGWRHLSYAAQWWVFAVAAVVFWVSAVRQHRVERAAGRSEDAGADATRR